MECAMDGLEFSTALRRVQCDDRVLTHLLLCEPPTTVRREGPHFETTYVKDGGPGLKKLCDAIGRNTHLRDVCFDAPLGLIDSFARTSHFDGLRRNESIRSLGLSRCDLDHGVGHEVLKAFGENHERLTKFALWRCTLGCRGPDALASTLAKCTRLTAISLSSCGIEDAIVEKLAEAVKGHHKLERLDLQENHIGRAGCQALATLLQDPECGLVDLDLHNNMIDNCGAKVMARALASNNKLEILCLDENCITDEGWNAYIHILCNKSSINTTFESNHILHTIASYHRFKRSGAANDDDGVIPPQLFELTYLNGRVRSPDPGRRRVHVAQQKVLEAHFHGDFDMAPFTEGSMDIKLLPHVLSWVGRNLWAQRWCYAMGHTALYELLRQTPTLCDVPSMAKGFVEKAEPRATGDRVAAGRREKYGSAGWRSRLGAILSWGMKKPSFKKLKKPTLVKILSDSTLDCDYWRDPRSVARHRQSGKNNV